MNYGLTSQGFRVKRQNEILRSMQSDTIEKFGNVQTDAASVIGQQLGVYSKPAIDVWEQLGNIYLALNPLTAEGVSLDFCCAFNGVKRLAAIPSECQVGFKGTDGSIIPEETFIKSSSNNFLFKTLTERILTKVDVSIAFAQINELVPNTAYSIAIAGGAWPSGFLASINSGPTPDYDTIIDNLVNQFNNEPEFIALAVNTGLGGIQFTSTTELPFTVITPDSKFDYYTSIKVQSVDLGDIPVSIRTIDTIETPVSGLDAVDNFIEGVKGRDRETDAELRIRREESLQVAGGAVLNSIVSRMLKEVTGVTICKGYENVEDIEVAGRPPHSIEIVVLGGSNIDIANQLWNTKGGGIKTHGNTSQNILDSNGDVQTMYFSRPTIVYGWISYGITLYDEEIFPVDGNALVRQYLLEYGMSHTVGLDIIPQRFVPGVITKIPGIDYIGILVARTELPDDPPSFVGTTISISETEIAVFSLDRIESPS